MEESNNASNASYYGRSNSSAAYLARAAHAVEQGDSILGIHLYLAAYERALHENLVPDASVIEGMTKAWELAVRTKQRSLAEYIFEKLEPFLDEEEIPEYAGELQRLAFDKLEEYGFDRSAIEGVAEFVNQDLASLSPEILQQLDQYLDQEGIAAAFGGEVETSDEAPQPAPPAKKESEAKQVSSKPDAQERMPFTAALAQRLGGSSSTSKKESQTQPRMDYGSLVGFHDAIAYMATLGVGRLNDPEFLQFVDVLNQRHGLPGIPGLGTLMFSSPSREDANYFMVATAGELRMPAIRMRLDRNAQGQAVLCVMASPDFKARISNLTRVGFESPTTVIIEDLDLWDLPYYDESAEDLQGLLQIQLSRGAREALALIQMALSSPEATVLISAAEPAEIDPYFWELIDSHRMVSINLPNDAERTELWRAAQSQHPSLRGLDVAKLVEFSHSLSRFDIVTVASEAVEEAYRKSIAANEFRAVHTEDILMRLANFQPLESQEYQHMEDLLVSQFRKQTSNFDDLLNG